MLGGSQVIVKMDELRGKPKRVSFKIQAVFQVLEDLL